MKTKLKKKRKEEISEVMVDDVAPADIDLDAIAERIEDIDDLALYIKALIFGPTGSGKTTIAGTFPKVIVLDCREEGTDSIRGKKAKRVKIKTWDDLEAMYWYLATKKHTFQSVFVDTIGQAADLALRKVMELDDHDGLPIRKHWGQMTQMVKTLFMDFRDLPMNVGFIAHVKKQDEDDIEEDEHTRVPMISPAVRKAVEGAVNLIGYSYIKEVRKEKGGKEKVDYSFRLRIGPSEDLPTKYRVPAGIKYPYVIKDPSFDKLFKILQKED